MEENQSLKVCQNCINYKRPKCKITGNFVARKNKCYDEEKHFKFKKTIKSISKKAEVKQQSDEDLKKQIFGTKVKSPKNQKPRKTKIK